MTGELTAIAHALTEIQAFPEGATCLLRFDCIPAMLLAAGVFKPKVESALVSEVREMWLSTAEKYELLHMHVKGHARIYGNVQADANADRGTTENTGTFQYRTIAELGGSVRFAELYHPGDCGLDSDLERKYAGKKKAKKQQTFARFEDAHKRAIQNHLRHLGCKGDKAAKILATIDSHETTGCESRNCS